MSKRIFIDRKHPDGDVIDQVVEALEEGGVIVYPTDTIYGLGCDIFNRDAVKRIYDIKGRDYQKPLSFICHDLSCIADFAVIPDRTYKILRRTLPGPYTFILRATRKAPKTVLHKKRLTVGIRVPACPAARMIVERLGHPIVTTSVNVAGDDFLTSPKKIEEQFGDKIDIILDAGVLPNEPSTIIDWSEEEPKIIREGKGSIKYFV